jgi:60 kDa SS-A/Ro ribonucleoprotein
MAINYARLFHRRITPQSDPIPGSAQVPNSAGGYAWPVDDWTRLDRFLILGAEGGTYYIGQRDLVMQNHDALVRCIQADGVRAVNRIIEISDTGRAPKNDPAIFALALVVTHGNPAAKALAFQNLVKVCRIGTHLFHFAEYGVQEPLHIAHPAGGDRRALPSSREWPERNRQGRGIPGAPTGSRLGLQQCRDRVLQRGT